MQFVCSAKEASIDGTVDGRFALLCVCVRCSSVQQLALLGQSLGVRLPPHYDHQWLNDGRCQARVAFNNMTFVGSQARTYEQAVESAASLALFNLVGFLSLFGHK